MIIQFHVPGIPQPKGSTRSFRHSVTGAVVTTGANPKGKAWEQRVALAAAAEMKGEPPTDVAVVVGCEFIFPRPKGHFGSGKNASRVKDSAPQHHTTKPDSDKLIRCLLDGMTSIVYQDDKQVIGYMPGIGKRYCRGSEPPGAIVTVQFEPVRTVGEWRERMGDCE